MTKENRYFYPVLPDTIHKFTNDICNSVLNSHSITFSNGSRAWMKFILNCPKHTDFYKKLNGYYICSFEPSEIIDYSKKGYFFELYRSLSKDCLSYDEVTLYELIEMIERQIFILLEEYKGIVIFIPRFNSFKDFNYEYGNLLYRLWRKDKQRILFVMSFIGVNIKEYSERIAGEFREVLIQNVHTVDILTGEDIKYSVKHWQEILKISLSDRIVARIVELSEASAHASKLLTHAAARYVDENEDKILLELEKTISKHKDLLSKCELFFDIEKTVFGDNNITSLFTGTQYEIIRALLIKKDEILLRDDIAQIIWGKEAHDKYSDWSIDKFISQIRNKLDQHKIKVQIKTIRSKGYMLILQNSND